MGTGSDDGSSEAEDVLGEWDDAEDEMYKVRLEQWHAKRGALTAADIAPGQAPGASAPAAGGGNAAEADAAEDLMADVAFDGGFSVPGNIYNRLFDYQKTGKLFSVPRCHPRAQGLYDSSRLARIMSMHASVAVVAIHNIAGPFV